MVMHKDLKSSLRKWNKTLWKRLKTYKQTYPKTSRGDVFFEMTWTPCGFCHHFASKGCNNTCPLYRNETCHNNPNNLPKQSPIFKMKKYWVRNSRGDRARFETERKKLIAIMKSHTDKFQKE